jgi:hypothetical protein
MHDFIATFHTHLAALRTHRKLLTLGLDARLAPVPRSLSASCGTCVKYSAEQPFLDVLDKDVERVVRILPKDCGYEHLLRNE